MLAGVFGRWIVVGGLAASAAAGGNEFRHLGLLVGRRVVIDRRATPLLKKSHAVQTGLFFDLLGLATVRLTTFGLTTLGLTVSLAIISLTIVGLTIGLAIGLPIFGRTVSLAIVDLRIRLTILGLAIVGLPMIGLANIALPLVGLVLIGVFATPTALVGRRMIAAILLRLTAGLALLLSRLIGLAFFAIFAPTEVVALDEAALGLDHPIIVIGILPVGLGQNAIAGGRRLSGQRLILVENLVRVAANPDVGATAIENLISIGRTVRIVILGLVMVVVSTAATAAATIATAARPLTIVWSH